jgi:hypothetical protein
VMPDTKKGSPPYSPPIRVTVNASTGIVAVEERAERAAAHRLLVVQHLRRERASRCVGGPKQRAAPKPPDADRMLAALAACFAPGEAVTNGQIERTANANKGRAIALKLWARSAGLWPYAQALGMRQKKGET